MSTRNLMSGDVFDQSEGCGRQATDGGPRTYTVMVPFCCPSCGRDEVLNWLTRAASPAEAMGNVEVVLANGRMVVEMLTGVRCEDDEMLAELYGHELFEAVGLEIGAPVVAPFPEP